MLPSFSPSVGAAHPRAYRAAHHPACSRPSCPQRLRVQPPAAGPASAAAAGELCTPPEIPTARPLQVHSPPGAPERGAAPARRTSYETPRASGRRRSAAFFHLSLSCGAAWLRDQAPPCIARLVQHSPGVSYPVPPFPIPDRPVTAAPRRLLPALPLHLRPPPGSLS